MTAHMDPYELQAPDEVTVEYIRAYYGVPDADNAAGTLPCDDETDARVDDWDLGTACDVEDTECESCQ